jgi:hypothetical protein
VPVQHHRFKRILCEGMTPEGRPDFRDTIAALRELDERFAGRRKRRASLKGRAEAIDREIDALVRGHRGQLLPYGAPGRLALDWAAKVLPLDNQRALEAANPVRPGGTLRASTRKNVWKASSAS